jgi:hypothetical protein
MKNSISCLFVQLLTVVSVQMLLMPAFADESNSSTTTHAATTNDYALTLRYSKEAAHTKEKLQPLFSKAVTLLESSNFNSRAPLWDWNMDEILEGYRKTVSGRYFLVSFKEPRKIKTIGGEVSVREIVIGLNGREYASSLYTIDDEGRIVGHAKHSGLLCVEFLTLVKKIAGPPNQGAAANRRPAGQPDGSGTLTAIVAADRAFPAKQ